MDWNDLKLFLDVARLGGLNAAARASNQSAATLGRRITALETALGESLFVRSRSGYALTRAGRELLDLAREVESGFSAIKAWQGARHGERVVRLSAGYWTSSFLAAHVTELWRPEDRFRIELVTANEKVDIGRRAADLGIRNARPTEQWLAGRLIGQVTYALYTGRRMIGGTAAGMFVAQSTEAAAPSSRWLEAHHGDRIGVRGNDPGSVRELVAAGAGLTVLPCFVGDSDTRLVRVAPIIPELTSEQWLVSHQEERHAHHVRVLGNRLAAIMKQNRRLFAGETAEVSAPPDSPDSAAGQA